MEFSTDWLASKPVFYNTKLNLVSHNIHDVIDYSNVEIHPEGFNNFLDYGYSVFGQSPIANVKFLEPNSSIEKLENGKVKVINYEDPVNQYLNYRLSEKEIFELIESLVQDWESTSEGEIVVPTSGGYDSRLLNFFVKDKSRIKSFTYGISPKQENSFECKYAQLLSEKFGTSWQQIKLGEFHNYFNEWDQLFGISTHAHGMYQIEFYRKMLHLIKKPGLFLSGIIGDMWAGSVDVPEINTIPDLINLSFNHGMNADSNASIIKSENFLKETFLNRKRLNLGDKRLRIVETVRMKMILLNYLINLPESLGFKPWSPYLDIRVAMAMINLPPNRRKNRIWQKEFFQKYGLDFSTLQLPIDKRNNLNFQAMMKKNPEQLNVKLLSEIMDRDYIVWINNSLKRFSTMYNGFYNITKLPKIHGLFRILKIKDTRLSAYFAYLVMRPIENVLVRNYSIKFK